MSVTAASTENGGVNIHGEVYFMSRQSNVTLHNLRVVFVADNGTTMRTVALGRFETGGAWNATFEANLSTPPKEIVFDFSKIETHNSTPFVITGERRESRDPPEYYEFTQETY